MIPMPKPNSVEDAVAVAASRRICTMLARGETPVPLGELGRVVGGSTPATTDPDKWGGDVVWVTPKDLGRPRAIEVTSSERSITEKAWPNLADKLLPVGTVLFSSRAPIGHVGIAGVPLCTNQGFKNVVCSQDLDSRYLFHILRGSVGTVRAQGRGNTFKEVPGKVLKRLGIPLPSVERQIGIASELDRFYLRLADGNKSTVHWPAGELDGFEEEHRILDLAARVVTLHRLHAGIGERLDALLPSLLGSSIAADRGLKRRSPSSRG